MNTFEIDIIPVIFELNDIPYHQEDIDDLTDKFNQYESYFSDKKYNLYSWGIAYRASEDIIIYTYFGNNNNNNGGSNAIKIHQSEIEDLSEADQKTLEDHVDIRDQFIYYSGSNKSDSIFSVMPGDNIHKIRTILNLDQIRFNNKRSRNIEGIVTVDDIVSYGRDILTLEDGEFREQLNIATSTASDAFKVHQLCFDGQYHSIEDTEYDIPNSPNLGIITEVFEFNNSRLVKLNFKKKNPYDYCHVISVEHQHEIYNYLDVGRKVLLYNELGSSYTISRRRGNKFCLGLFHEMEPDLPDDDILKKLTAGGYHRKTNEILDIEDVREDATNIVIQERQERQAQKREQAIKDKIVTKAKELSEDDIKVHGVIFREDEVEYEGQKLKICSSQYDNSDWVADIITSLVRVYGHDNINFDRVLDKFIKRIAKDPDAKAIIGDVKVHSEIKVIEHKNDRQQHLHYINDARINKDEVVDCLERALCYTTDKDFTNFLNQVSKCSLKYHRYLHNGLDFRVVDPLKSNIYNIKIPMERRGNINYLDVNGELYRISNSNKVIKNTGRIDLDDLRKLLTNDDIVNDITLQDLVPILKEGKQQYIDAITKSKQLVEETEELFDLSIDVHQTKQSGDIKGYKIEGNMRDYVVEFDPDVDINRQSHGVYEYPSGRYICIVDKSTDQVGYDKLVNRIYALHNDSVVASKISTLN